MELKLPVLSPLLGLPLALLLLGLRPLLGPLVFLLSLLGPLVGLKTALLHLQPSELQLKLQHPHWIGGLSTFPGWGP